MKFKIGDKVRVIADEEALKHDSINDLSLTGREGEVIDIVGDDLPYEVKFSWGRYWWLNAEDLELVDENKKESNPKDARTFDTGATRDTAQGKLDYVKALSPIVLKRYVEYLDKHRLQSDGSYRDFDNWKQGIPQEVYHSSGGRHFIDTWLLTDGYAAEDNRGPVELEDAICAQLFNLMGRLYEMLEGRGYCKPTDRDKPGYGGDVKCD